MQMRRWCTLEPHLAEREFVSMSVGFDGCLYVLLADAPTAYQRLGAGGALFAVVQPPSLQSYRIVVVGRDQSVHWLDLSAFELNFHIVQPMPDGSFLLVCARSEHRGPDDFDRNGVVVSSTGRVLRQFLLGDGIEDVQVDERGVIWTSYFDEGVLGNFGWDRPVGSSGLVAWDAAGERLYEYTPPGDVDSICDCYAMNVVSAREMWIYYYYEFPLVRLTDRSPTADWSGLPSGCRAFAIAGEKVLLCGDYDRRATCHLFAVRDGRPPEPCGKSRLLTDAGIALGRATYAARRELVFATDGTVVYQTSIDEWQVG